MQKNYTNKKGFTLVELLISVSILVIMLGVIMVFVKSFFSFNRTQIGSLNVAAGTRNILNPITSEIRSATISSLGAYPLETVADSTFTFYADADNDGLKEKIRYFYTNNKLQRGVVKPTGSPLAYTGAETVTTIVDNVRNDAATPVFSYYDSNYTGSSAALTQPVSISVVRLVKITLVLDADVNNPPAAITSTTQVSLRNLKDNL
jgi:prepilin-type N-terminal cleavage/methylation domain-containing protein